MRMQDKPLYFATSSNELTTVSSRMAPIQVVHNIYVITLKSPGATSLCYCSIHVDASSIDKDSMTSSYIHQKHESTKRADYQKPNQDISVE